MKTDLTDVDAKTFDALLAESNQITASIRGIQDTQRRMLGFLPPVLAVGLPLLLKAATDVPAPLRASIFVGLGLMFLFLAANYIGLTRHILLLSTYHMEHLSPKINEIINAPITKVFRWEKYVREHGRQPGKELLGYFLIHGAEFALLLSPSLACFGIGAYYLVMNTWLVALAGAGAIYLAVLLTILYFAYLTVQQSRATPSEF